MALGEVQVNQDLMATIAAIIGGTIPLGAVMFALIRWVDGRFRKDMAALREEMQASEGRLRKELQASRGRLEDGIREITERLVNVGDRLSKVEGVMEGMFWSARNQPPEAPRERAGAA